jgi:DNA-binding response OmpR family regulator
MPGAKILIVEDDPRLAEMLRAELSNDGHEAVAVKTGTDGLMAAEMGDFDLILLDLNLPDIDGIEVASRLYGTSKASLLMLTARGDVSSRVRGLYAGASDYLTKPFSLQELLARVHVRLRERQQAPEIIRHGELELNLSDRTCAFAKEPLLLTALEFELLKLLLSHRGRIFSKEDLERRLYGEGGLPGSNTVEVFISNLRKKLAQRGVGNLIQTVRKMGYFIR